METYESDWRHIQAAGTGLAGFGGTLAAHIATGIGPNILTVTPTYFATQHFMNKAYKNGIRKDMKNAYKKEFHHINKYGENHPKTQKISNHVGKLENEYFDRYGSDDHLEKMSSHVNTKENMAKKDKHGNIQESVWRHAGLVGGVVGGGFVGAAAGMAVSGGNPGAGLLGGYGGGRIASKEAYNAGLDKDIENAQNKHASHMKKYGADHPQTIKIANHINKLKNSYMHSSRLLTPTFGKKGGGLNEGRKANTHDEKMVDHNDAFTNHVKYNWGNDLFPGHTFSKWIGTKKHSRNHITSYHQFYNGTRPGKILAIHTTKGFFGNYDSTYETHTPPFKTNNIKDGLKAVNNVDDLNEGWRHVGWAGGGVGGGVAGIGTGLAIGAPRVAGIIGGTAAYFTAKAGYKHGLRRDLKNANKHELNMIKTYGHDHPKTKKAGDHFDKLSQEYSNQYGEDDWWKKQ